MSFMFIIMYECRAYIWTVIYIYACTYILGLYASMYYTCACVYVSTNTYLSPYICIYVCIYVGQMYVCKILCMNEWVNVLCMYVFMFVMYICKVCLYVWMHAWYTYVYSCIICFIKFYVIKYYIYGCICHVYVLY